MTNTVAVHTSTENRRIFAPLNTIKDHRSVYQVLAEKTPSSSVSSSVYLQRNPGTYQGKITQIQTKPQVRVCFRPVFFVKPWFHFRFYPISTGLGTVYFANINTDFLNI